jgi:hypothetical protein
MDKGFDMNLGFFRCQCLVLCLFSLTFLGCGGDDVSDAFREMNKLNMQKLTNSYVMFASVNGGVGPKDADELKNFIKTDERVPPRLGMSSSDLEDLDSIFISDADGEPFKIRFGLKIQLDEDRSPLIFDDVGVDGMRRVALANNEILEVSDAKKYDRMWTGRASNKDAGPDESEIDGEFDAE